MMTANAPYGNCKKRQGRIGAPSGNRKAKRDGREDTMTKAEYQDAVVHAEAVIRLVASLDPEKYGEAADEWVDKYGGNLENQ